MQLVLAVRMSFLCFAGRSNVMFKSDTARPETGVFVCFSNGSQVLASSGRILAIFKWVTVQGRDRPDELG